MAAKKKISVAAQLKAALADANEQRNHATRLMKDIEQAKQSSTYANERASRAERELADVHAFLDAVPNPPADKTGEYNTKLSAMTRLSVFLATR